MNKHKQVISAILEGDDLHELGVENMQLAQRFLQQLIDDAGDSPLVLKMAMPIARRFFGNIGWHSYMSASDLLLFCSNRMETFIALEAASKNGNYLHAEYMADCIVVFHNCMTTKNYAILNYLNKIDGMKR